MKSVLSINSADVLTLDIETVRIKKNFSELTEEFKSAWAYKMKQDGETLEEEELADKWTKMASLYAEFSKVCAISLTYLKDGVLKCKNYAGTDEKEILNSFASDIKAFFNINNKYRFLGHAARYFDYPFLCKRYIINGFEVPSCLDESASKPWEMKNLDTNELWRSFGTGPGSSLQALCTTLDIPISKVDLIGDEVGEAFYRGELDRIAQYCSLDTIATFNVFRFFKKEPIFQFSDVVYVGAKK